jgi:HSP20 family molecular chaperone IbpA
MSLFGYTDPWSDLRDMQRQMDRLMGWVGADITPTAFPEVPLLTGGPTTTTGGQLGVTPRIGAGAGQLALGQWNPFMDVRQTDKGLVVHAELPGCNKDDIKLSIDQNRLILEGQKRTHHKEKGENWVRKERFEGSFYRTLPLPRGVEPNQIQANYQDGVLEVFVPTPAGAPQKQAIDIKSSQASTSGQEQQISGQEQLGEKGKEQVPIGGERGQK